MLPGEAASQSKEIAVRNESTSACGQVTKRSGGWSDGVGLIRERVTLCLSIGIEIDDVLVLLS